MPRVGGHGTRFTDIRYNTSVSDLTARKCIPCEAGTPPLSQSRVEELLPQVPGWTTDGVKLEREFLFKDFKASMHFINQVADLAESEGHHPDIYVFYSRVKLTLWTHAIGGLSDNDFILAAKINSLTPAS